MLGNGDLTNKSKPQADIVVILGRTENKHSQVFAKVLQSNKALLTDRERP